ncbi:MAG: hypothetical protein ACREE7_04430, partial [Dongiaceae bacterium]
MLRDGRSAMAVSGRVILCSCGDFCCISRSMGTDCFDLISTIRPNVSALFRVLGLIRLPVDSGGRRALPGGRVAREVLG